MKTSVSRRIPASAGFTLIELMVTIAIGAILATIAISGYTSQIRKSRRTEARTALLEMASREERFMSTNSAYSATPADLGYGGAFPMVVGSGYYRLSAPAFVPASATAPATFTLTATPVAGMGQDKDTACTSFSVDSTGAQTALAGAVSTTACWN